MFKIIGADQKQYGPISEVQIRQWIIDGRLNAHTQAQRDGAGDWLPLSAFPEFADIFNPAPADTSSTYTPPPMPGPMGAPAPTGTRENALNAVKGPAIALIVAAALGIAFDLLGAFYHLSGLDQHPTRNTSPETRAILLHFQGATGGMLYLGGVALNAFILFGAIKMMRLDNFNLVLAACIVAVIPCTGYCCILSLAFGIWALVVINKTEIKSQFS
jgi:hypothetical protein